jgi:hypothetical protein
MFFALYKLFSMWCTIELFNMNLGFKAEYDQISE